MKRMWQRWMVVGLLAGGALTAGCMNQDKGHQDTGPFQTPLQDKYQSPAAEAGQQPGAGTVKHPSARDENQDESAALRPGQTQDIAPLGGGTAGPNDGLPPGTGGSGQAGQMGPPGEGLGTGLAESYDAAPPQQGTGGSGQQAPLPAQPQDGQQQGATQAPRR
jgi:hypothetical protein